MSNIDPTAAFPFGHGLGYAAFEWEPLGTGTDVAETTTDGTVSLRLRRAATPVTGDGAEVVQRTSTTPWPRSCGPCSGSSGSPGSNSRRARRRMSRSPCPPTSPRSPVATGRRIVEPGELVLSLGRSSADLPIAQTVRLTGPVREVDHTRRLHPIVLVEPVAVKASVVD